MSNYDESFDPAGGFDDGPSDGGTGLPPEGECEVMPTSDTIEIGWQKGGMRCAWTVNVYRGQNFVTAVTMYQGLDVRQPKALEVTEKMLVALGAVDPIADIQEGIKRGLNSIQLRGMNPEKRARGKLKHDTYEGKTKLEVAIFGDAFREKVPAAERQAQAAGLAGWQRANPRGAPISPPQPRR